MRILLAVAVVGIAGSAWAWTNPYDNKRPYRDAWGNSYKYQQNLYKDTDRDGVINLYDYNDRNRYIQNPYQSQRYGPAPTIRRQNYLLNDEE